MSFIKKYIIILVIASTFTPVFVFAGGRTDCVCSGTPIKCYRPINSVAECVTVCAGASNSYGVGATVTGCVSWLTPPAVEGTICLCADGSCAAGVDRDVCEGSVEDCNYIEQSGISCPAGSPRFVVPEILPDDVPPLPSEGTPEPAPAGATSPETVSLTNPLKDNITDVPTLVGMIIKAALGIIGAVSLFVFIMGGFEWLTSLGNQEKISKGAKTMLWAVLGLVITFGSYLIINLLLKV